MARIIYNLSKLVKSYAASSGSLGCPTAASRWSCCRSALVSELNHSSVLCIEPEKISSSSLLIYIRTSTLRMYQSELRDWNWTTKKKNRRKGQLRSETLWNLRCIAWHKLNSVSLWSSGPSSRMSGSRSSERTRNCFFEGSSTNFCANAAQTFQFRALPWGPKSQSHTIFSPSKTPLLELWR